jgi:hypothetical protein
LEYCTLLNIELPYWGFEINIGVYNMKLLQDTHAIVDIGIVIMIGVVFGALMVIGYIIWKLKDQLNPSGDALNSINNITNGFDDGINLILVAITVFILAVAISALLMLRGQ